MKIRPKKKTSGNTLVTTTSPHSDQIIYKLIFKYLNMVYPVVRVKINGKFKRSIDINGRIYSVSTEKNNFIPIIMYNISDSFNINDIDVKNIIFEYFKIQKINFS
jgi:hypothetical protein